jgi:hypothetical protein
VQTAVQTAPNADDTAVQRDRGDERCLHAAAVAGQAEAALVSDESMEEAETVQVRVGVGRLGVRGWG